MWKLRPNEFKADAEILIGCATEPEFEFIKHLTAVHWTRRQVLIFKRSILRIPVMKMSGPHSNPEKSGYVKTLWSSDLRNDYDQDLILFVKLCSLLYLYQHGGGGGGTEKKQK